MPLLRCLQCLLDKLVPLQEPVVQVTGLIGTIIGDGAQLQMVDGVMGPGQAGPRQGSGRVLGMGQALEAGQAQDMVMGLGVVALKVVGMVLEVGLVILLVVVAVEEAVDRVAMENNHHLTPDREPTMGEGVGLESMCENVILEDKFHVSLYLYIVFAWCGSYNDIVCSLSEFATYIYY